MPLQIMLAANLRRYIPTYDPATGYSLEVEPGTDIRSVADQLGIPGEEVKLIMVNGIGAKWETVLQGNERLALFPPVGGG